MEDEGFWCPNLIDQWRNFLSRGVPSDGALRHRRPFISNLGYSLQYLQFLDYQIREVNLHATVYTHTLKSFVIAGMGIIEAVSWYLLKRKGWNRKHDWEQIAELQSRRIGMGMMSSEL